MIFSHLEKFFIEKKRRKERCQTKLHILLQNLTTTTTKKKKKDTLRKKKKKKPKVRGNINKDVSQNWTTLKMTCI